MKGAVEAIRENPSWARMPPVWMKVALWSFGYTSDPVPTRQDIARALITVQAKPGETKVRPRER
jgi:hypothetical protein